MPLDMAGVSAVTRDLSAGGVYFHSDQRFVPGARIEFALALPRLASDGVTFNCTATVVRVDDEPSGCGIAARFDRFTWIYAPPSSSRGELRDM